MSATILSNGFPAPHLALKTGMPPTTKGSSGLGVAKSKRTTRSLTTTTPLTSA